MEQSESDSRQNHIHSPIVSFITPAWHFYFHLGKQSYLSPALRAISVKSIKLATTALFKPITLLTGASFCTASPKRTAALANAKKQHAHLGEVLPVAASYAKTWELLAYKFQPEYAIRLTVANTGIVRYWILLMKDGSPLAYLERTFSKDQRSVSHDYMAFVLGKGGKGGASQLLGNAALMYSHIGIKSITLTAGLSAGGAVWPKMGFHPVNTKNWNKVKKVIEANCLELSASIHQKFYDVHGRSLQAVVDAVLQGDDPEDIFDIVDIDPKDQVGRICRLQYGIAGELLKGARWKGILHLQGRCWNRLELYLKAKNVDLPKFSA